MAGATQTKVAPTKTIILLNATAALSVSRIPF